MARNIERLLRLIADYHRFCDEDIAEVCDKSDPDELKVEELDLIAAAGNMYASKDLQTD